MENIQNKVLVQKILDKIEAYPNFQKKVWKACATIPKGEVRTYKWIAQRIGKPKAYRAVANALKMNPFYPHVPCHRVIRSDGGLGGYSAPGGMAQKRKLLAKEGALRKLGI